MAELFPVIKKNDIRLNNIPLWLDARKKKDFSFVSHAHSDHIGRHKKILASKETIRLFEYRIGKVSAIECEYNTPFTLWGKVFNCFPSGHILGSLQILIEDEIRLVYTGDIKLKTGLTTRKIEIKKCDGLIIESTFDDPRYIFPPLEEIQQRIMEFISSTVKLGAVPLFYTYPLGKSQELIAMLGNLGFRMSVHPTIYATSKIYEEFGVPLKNYESLNFNRIKGKVFILPPSARVEFPKPVRTCVVTGWAIDRNAKYRYGADEAIPMSDHADYNDLINYISTANPQKVWVINGAAKFINYLKKEGFEAVSITSS